ncbi:MAG: hypothetical protein JRI86_05915 [Deltaproteobacteria bacterium]|nr:hypothetical protein [Deltaproteobacteria bacterium]
MMIDIMPDISVQQSLDIRQVKRIEEIEPRSIERSGTGNHSELDTDKQNNTKKRDTKGHMSNVSPKIQTYNTKGNLAKERPVEIGKKPSRTIDLMV